MVGGVGRRAWPRQWAALGVEPVRGIDRRAVLGEEIRGRGLRGAGKLPAGLQPLPRSGMARRPEVPPGFGGEARGDRPRGEVVLRGPDLDLIRTEKGLYRFLKGQL